jgi:hypothetical protein
LADFSSNKSEPANRKTGFYATEQAGAWIHYSFLHEAAQNFEVFSNIQE